MSTKPIDFELDAAGKEQWKRLLPAAWNRRGKQTEIRAEILKRFPGLNESSLTNWLSSFGNGHKAGLQAVLGNDKWADIVAGELGLQKAHDLWDLFERVGRLDTQVGLFEVLVPGFEDFGAVPVDEVFVAVNAGMSWRLPDSHRTDRLGHHGTDVHAALVDIVARHPLESFRFSVLGPAGSGKTIWQKHLAWSFAQADMRVFAWRPAELPPKADGRRLVAICDDTACWTSDEWKRLSSWLEAASGVALVSWEDVSPLPEGPHNILEAKLAEKRDDDPKEHTGASFAGASDGWKTRPTVRHTVARQLERLAVVARTHWGRSFDPTLMLTWFDGNPFAGALLDEPAAMYRMARTVLDGGKPDPVGLLKSTAWQCAARLEERAAPAALFLRQLGERLATRLVELTTSEPTRLEVAAVVVEMLDDARLCPKGTRWAPTDALAIVDSLVETGFLKPSSRDRNRISLAFRMQRVVAHAESLRRTSTPVPSDRAATLVASEEGTDALLLRATSLGDLTEVIGWIRGQPAEVRAQCGPVVTRLLATGVPCRDADAVRWAFRFALTWGLCWGAPSYPWRLAGPSPPFRERELRIGGQQVVGLLGRASCVHRLALGGEELVPLSSRESPELYALAALLGRSPVGADQLAVPLILSTCGASESLDAALWQRLVTDHGSTAERIVPHHVFTDWWTLTGNEYLQARGEAADTLLAGTGALVLTPEQLEFDRPRGLVVDALVRRLVAGDAAAPARFAIWLADSLKAGSTPQRDHLKSGWGHASPAQRAEIADGLTEALCGGVPKAWVRVSDAGDSEWSRGLRADRVWALTSVLGADRARAVATAWCGCATPTLPWSELLDALPDVGPQLVDWIEAAAVNEDSSSHSPLVDDVAAAASVDPDAWRRHQAYDQQTAMAWLCRFGTVETLEKVIERFGYRSALRWAGSAALRELGRRDPARLRLHRIKAAIGRGSTERLGQFHPLPGERILWEAVFRAEGDEDWRFVRAVQLAVAAGDGDSRVWNEAIALLPVANDPVAEDDDPRAWPQVSLGEALFYGAEWAPSGVKRVVEAIMISAVARYFVCEPFIAAAQRVLGPELVINWIDTLLAAHSETSPGPLMRWSIFGWGGEEAARLAFARPRLRQAAAEVIAAHLRADAGEFVVGLLDAALDGATRRRGGGIDAPLALLLEAATRRAPAQTLEWIDRHPGVATKAMWRALVPQLPPGPHRARALRASAE